MKSTTGLARPPADGGDIAGTRVHSGDDLGSRCDDLVNGVLNRWALQGLAPATLTAVRAAVGQALALDDHADIRLRRLPDRLEIDIRPCHSPPRIPEDSGVRCRYDGESAVLWVPLPGS